MLSCHTPTNPPHPPTQRSTQPATRRSPLYVRMQCNIYKNIQLKANHTLHTSRQPIIYQAAIHTHFQKFAIVIYRYTSLYHYVQWRSRHWVLDPRILWLGMVKQVTRLTQQYTSREGEGITTSPPTHNHSTQSLFSSISHHFHLSNGINKSVKIILLCLLALD